MGWVSELSMMLLAVLILGQPGENEAARILGMFPLPVKSHFVMAESLMKGLAARGHRVDVVSSFPMKNPPPNYRDISLAELFPPVVNNLTLNEAKTYTTRGLAEIMQEQGGRLCKLLDSPQIRNIIENPPNDPPYDLLINEQVLADCYLALGRHLKVPIVGLVTSKLYDWMSLPMGNVESTAFVPSIFTQFTQRMSFLERFQNTIISYYLQFNYWYYNAPVQMSYVEKHFGTKDASMRDLWRDVAILLVNTHPSFDLVRPMPPGIVEVGGLHVTDGDLDLSPEVKKWLDDSKDGCVYFSFGSMVKIESFPTETVEAFYEAFKRIAPVRVLMKIAKTNELPSGLPANVMTSPWLPQTRVLQHKNVKAFVTHGGLMSTQEAVTYGVPMIGIPIFADQYLNTRLCERHNVTIAMDYRAITAESFEKSLKEILNNPSYRENSKRLARSFNDRPMSPLDTAIFWVEHAIRNGNMLRSPADQLTWWQLASLDVYGFLLATLLLSIYIAKRLLTLTLRLLCSCSTSGKKQATRKSNTQSKLKKNK